MPVLEDGLSSGHVSENDDEDTGTESLLAKDRISTGKSVCQGNRVPPRAKGPRNRNHRRLPKVHSGRTCLRSSGLVQDSRFIAMAFTCTADILIRRFSTLYRFILGRLVASWTDHG